MNKPFQQRKIKRRIFRVVVLAACVFILAAVFLGLWHAAEMRNIVGRQFNEEQLAIARNAAGLIERELRFLEKELRLISADIVSLAGDSVSFNPARLEPLMEKSLVRVNESGVRKIRLIIDDGVAGGVHHFIPGDYWQEDLDNDLLSTVPEKIPEGSVWISSPQADSARLNLAMAAGLPEPVRGLVVFDINISWLLNPFVKDIKSGKTGYAWIICENGFFLYHPKVEFIGRDAFNVRQEEDPRHSYHTINFIQQEKMLRGLEGAGSYRSGWHRGATGQISKLIAYTPIQIGGLVPRKWSIAVVAPVSEIEGLVKNAYNRQLLLQLLILIVIISAACALWFLEKRWSRFLEIEVRERTQALAGSEEKYRSLVESADDFIFTVNRDGIFQSVNTFTAAFFGKHPVDCAGQPLSFVFPESLAGRMNELVRQVFGKRRSVREIFEIIEKNHRIWINANFMPLKDKKRKISSVLCIARDITEQKNLEGQLINAEKLASLGTLAAGVAHEINNPLSVILGFSDILIRRADPSSQAFEDLKTIERQGLHCKEIVENLLSFARHGRETSQITDVRECIKEVIKVVRHTLEMNEVALEVFLPENFPEVTGDYRHLQQVFLNLINNAVSAMPDGGALRISGWVESTGRKAVLSFADTGTGIAEENMAHIFEPFYTTKPEGEGTGLGLFISYGIINRYGGSIECISGECISGEYISGEYISGECTSGAGADSDRSGATFIIRLPAA